MLEEPKIAEESRVEPEITGDSGNNQAGGAPHDIPKASEASKQTAPESQIAISADDAQEATVSRAALESVRNQIDAVQMRLDRESKPWYANISNWTALIAVAFSTYTLVREKYADIHARKSEIRTIIDQILSVHDELAQISDPAERLQASYIADYKRRLYFEDADELISQFPHQINSTEYALLAVESVHDGNFDRAIEYAEKSLPAATDDYARVFAHRCMAAMYYYRFDVGDLEKMRAEYTLAGSILKKMDRDFYWSTTAQTYHNWALAEFDKGDVNQAKQLVAKSKDAIGHIQFGRTEVATKQWDQEFTEAERLRNANKHFDGNGAIVQSRILDEKIPVAPAGVPMNSKDAPR